MIKLAIPTTGNLGLESTLSPHFGHAPYFTVITLNDEKVVETVDILEKPAHKPGQAPLMLRDQGVNLLCAGSLGRSAVQILQKNGIELIPNLSGTVASIVAQFQNGEITPVSDYQSSCNHGDGHHNGKHQHRHNHRHGGGCCH